MELKFGRKKEYPFLVLDIGTEAVKAVMVKKNADKISILNSSLRYLKDEGTFNRGFSEEEFEMEIIKRAVLEVKKDLSIKEPVPAILTLSPKVLKAKVVEGISVREKREKKISKREQDIIYRYAIKAARGDILKDISERSGILPKDIRFVSLEIIKKDIEGYKVEDIQNHQGKNLSFKILATYILNSYLERISEIAKETRINVVQTVHLVEAVRKAFSQKPGEIVFFDVGGEAVQAFFIKSGILDGVEVFNNGGMDFTQRILDVLTLEKEEARRLKEDYSEGSLTPETEARIKDIFSNEKKVWRDIFRNSQKSSVFLSGGGSLLPEVKGMFKRRQIIDVKYLKSVEDLSNRTKSPQFVPSILISLL